MQDAPMPQPTMLQNPFLAPKQVKQRVKRLRSVDLATVTTFGEGRRGGRVLKSGFFIGGFDGRRLRRRLLYLARTAKACLEPSEATKDCRARIAKGG